MAEIMQFTQRRSAAEIQKRESEVEAKQIELGAIQREADRKAKLAKALASQTASAGARGISAFEGSPLSVLQADIETAERGASREEFQSRLASMTTKARGRIAERQIKAAALTSLIRDVETKASAAAKAGAGG